MSKLGMNRTDACSFFDYNFKYLSKHITFLDTIRENLGSMHPSPQISGFTEPTHTPQVAIVSGGVESVLTSPSPPGKLIF